MSDKPKHKLINLNFLCSYCHRGIGGMSVRFIDILDVEEGFNRYPQEGFKIEMPNPCGCGQGIIVKSSCKPDWTGQP